MEPEDAPRRTKLVFLYSSEDDDDEREKESGERQREKEAPALRPPADELRAMRAEAAEAERAEKKRRDGPLPPPPLSSFSPLSSLSPLSPFAVVEDTAGVPQKSRVKTVPVPPLHAYSSHNSNDNNGNGETLRRRLRVSEVERLASSRQRFLPHEENGEESGKDNGEESGKENGEESGKDNGAECPRPVLDSDGLVTAVAVGGYQLTVDEQQLQGNDEPEEEEGEELDCAGDGDEDFEEEEEDEEDDELDDAIVVAVVERLVQCCRSDELDEALQEDGRRFLERATPFLERLYAEEMSLETFGEEMRGNILRLQRAFQRVNRPKDVPIVIDGVVMDM